MKLLLSFKDPDWDQNSIYEYVSEDLPECIKEILTKEEVEAVIEKRVEKIHEKLVASWIEFGEYLNLEYDVESDTLKAVRFR